MKTIDEILNENWDFTNPYEAAKKCMILYGNQIKFKTKPCPCIQQEIDLKNIAEKGVSNNNWN